MNKLKQTKSPAHPGIAASGQ